MPQLRPIAVWCVKYFSTMAKYHAMKRRAANAPKREVTRAEFKRLLIASGSSTKEAEFQTKISEGLRDAWAVIGDTQYRITSPTPGAPR